jgi:hypothetical protein
MKLEVQVNQQFGKLTVVDPEVRLNGVRAALCQCSCGSMKTALLKRLVHGRTQSCGCIKREQTVERNKATARWGGATNNPLFGHWSAMMNRCYNPAAGNYQWYGGRGICVCEPFHDPRVFIEYVERELGPCPEAMSLDRKENDGNYEPGNLRWATAAEQARNRRPRRRQ